MLKYRIISFPLLLALVAAVFFWKTGGVYLFSLLAVAGSAALLFEAGRLCNKIDIKNDPLFCAVCGALLSAAFLAVKLPLPGDRAPCFQLFPAVLAAVVMLPCVYALFMLIGKKTDAVRRAAGDMGILGIFGIPVLLLEMLYFKTLGGIPLLFYVICVTKAMDTGGYIFGMASARLLPGGNHKIAPSISPKKSWEGVAGGMLFSVTASLIFRHFCGGDLLVFIAHGVILSLLSLAGDLTESSLKRAAGVKDSANWIPGMGGVFDVLDSFLYVGYFMLFSNIGQK
ncbi:MAG: phosphatidate cytidylyltransferase [Lentisphaeria bacterium]|nr:phosphatidate cytidylyltransferase [Lentisphaeria bacterium]